MKIAVIGTGLTKFGELWSKGLNDLLAEAQLSALKEANIEANQIEEIFTGNMCAGEFSGQLHVGAMASENLNLNVPSTRVEGACASGSIAIRNAIQLIESGKAKIVMANGVEKMTDVSTPQATSGLMGAGSEEWEEFQGATFPGLYAMMARAYMHKFSVPKEVLAMVAVKNHKHGTMNPKAQFRREITVEQALNATMVADPLTLLDCSPISDGAGSIILASEETAKELGLDPVFIVASSQASDSLALHSRKNLYSTYAAKVAAEKAYKQAGISAKDINVAEVHDCFTIAEIMAIEALGFAELGKARELIEANETYYNGAKPINTSGGLKAAGHPIGATGLKQAIEIVHQLKGEAGERQVKNAEIGLTHNVGGTGATVVVNVFKR